MFGKKYRIHYLNPDYTVNHVSPQYGPFMLYRVLKVNGWPIRLLRVLEVRHD